MKGCLYSQEHELKMQHISFTNDILFTLIKHTQLLSPCNFQFAALPVHSKRFGRSSQNATNVGHGTFLLKGIYIRFDNVI